MSEITGQRLLALKRLEVDFRREMAGTRWRQPEPLDSLRFALTEAVEAIDVLLRERDYARNHERAGDLFAEWTDAAVMLLSALPADLSLPGSVVPDPVAADLDGADRIALLCARALARYRDGDPFWHLSVAQALALIDSLPGYDFEAEFCRFQAKIRHHHRWRGA